MPIMIEGSDGLIQVGPTNALTTVGVVTSFSVEASTELTPRGPYIGDATISKTRQPKTSTGSLSAEIPSGRDAGQTQLMTAHESGTSVRVSLKAGAALTGYTYTATVAISGISFSGNAADGYMLDISFEDTGSYTLAASA
jgi:hypothetical protein